MITPFVFLTCVIPSPKNSKNKIDIYLQPLIDELKELCDLGIEMLYESDISIEG